MAYVIPFKQEVRTIIHCLRHEPQWMRLLLPSEKPYVKLIDHLLSTQSKYEEDNNSAPRETVVGFARELNEKSALVNKWLREIYDDILELNIEHPELFKKTGEIICRFEYYSKIYQTGFSFSLGVQSVPQIGDYFELFFVNATANEHQFVVKEVTHRYEHGKMEIEIELGQQYYERGLYRKLLVEKARFLDLISIEDEFGPEFMLDKKLKKVLKQELI